MRHAVLVFLALLAAATYCSSAEIYQWTDKYGRRHFTDDPSKVPRDAPARDGEARGREEEKTEAVEGKEEAAEFKGLPDLEGVWKGWGMMEFKRGADSTSYTGTYTDTLKTDIGLLELSLLAGEGGMYAGKWREGKTRIGELKFKIYNGGRAIMGSWCALEASAVQPGNPPCAHPASFKWERFDAILTPID